jgi:hypothetical protein
LSETTIRYGKFPVVPAHSCLARRIMSASLLPRSCRRRSPNRTIGTFSLVALQIRYTV